MDTMIRVQNLGETVCLSHTAYTKGKRINPIFFLQPWVNSRTGETLQPGFAISRGEEKLLPENC